MKPKTMKVLELCIQDGLIQGWARAHKHNDAPSPYDIQDAQQNAIMGEIWEWFDINGESDEH